MREGSVVGGSEGVACGGTGLGGMIRRGVWI